VKNGPQYSISKKEAPYFKNEKRAMDFNDRLLPQYLALQHHKE